MHMADELAVDDFTADALKVFALARKVAEQHNHNFMGTEHVMLGIIQLQGCTANTVLRLLGIEPDVVQEAVTKQLGQGPEQKTVGDIPYTPRTKKVLRLAAKEAHALNHDLIGTEHILIAILREGDGVVARVLRDLGLDIENLRRETLRMLDPNFAQRPAPAPPAGDEKPEPAGDQDQPQGDQDMWAETFRQAFTDLYCAVFSLPQPTDPSSPIQKEGVALQNAFFQQLARLKYPIEDKAINKLGQVISEANGNCSHF
jgi:ATP-dependent Clp protease ATP-binding subunit ClpA